MMVHRGGETTLIDFFVAAPGLDGIERARRAGRRCRSTSTPRRCRRSTSARPPAACPAPPPAWCGRWSGSARCRSPSWSARRVALAREGAPVNAEQAYILDILAPIHDRLDGHPRALRAGRAARCARATSSASRELAEALERFGAEGAEPFYRGEVAAALSDFVVEHGGTLGPRRPCRLRGDRAPADRARLPRHRGADQPAAVLGRDPDRLLPRPARAARRAQRARAAGRGDGRRQRPARRGVRRGALRGGDGGGSARPGRPRPRGRRPARLDHPHLGPRRRRDVRQRHLLQRLRLRACWCRAPG